MFDWRKLRRPVVAAALIVEGAVSGAQAQETPYIPVIWGDDVGQSGIFA